MSFSRVVLDFEPARDGFSFPNAFRWTAADLDLLARLYAPAAHAAAALPALGAAAAGGWRGALAGAAAGAALEAAGFGPALLRGLAQRWPSFGLCGGMALAAAERWPARSGSPTAELRPEHVRELLWQRQAQALRASGATFLRRWLAARLRPERAAPAPALLEEWARLRARIDAGRPAVVGLVGDAPDPFAQHQVLAFGYAGTERRGTLFVYDPNAPGEGRRIAFTTAASRARITTDLPVGPRPGGGCHVGTRPGRLAFWFVLDV